MKVKTQRQTRKLFSLSVVAALLLMGLLPLISIVAADLEETTTFEDGLGKWFLYDSAAVNGSGNGWSRGSGAHSYAGSYHLVGEFPSNDYNISIVKQFDFDAGNSAISFMTKIINPDSYVNYCNISATVTDSTTEEVYCSFNESILTYTSYTNVTFDFGSAPASTTSEITLQVDAEPYPWVYLHIYLDNIEIYGATENVTDTEEPTFPSWYNTNSNSGSSNTIYAYVLDDYEVDGYIYETNNTGSFVNDTWAAYGFQGGSTYKTITNLLTYDDDVYITVNCYINDSSNNWNSSSYSFLLVPNEYPYYTLNGYTSSAGNEETTVYSKWYDNWGLSGYICSINFNGTWVNSTWTSFSSPTPPQWANYTFMVNNSYISIFWKFYANDTLNGWNQTETDFFVVTSVDYEYGIVVDSFNQTIYDNYAGYYYEWSRNGVPPYLSTDDGYTNSVNAYHEVKNIYVGWFTFSDIPAANHNWTELESATLYLICKHTQAYPPIITVFTTLDVSDTLDGANSGTQKIPTWFQMSSTDWYAQTTDLTVHYDWDDIDAVNNFTIGFESTANPYDYGDYSFITYANLTFRWSEGEAAPAVETVSDVGVPVDYYFRSDTYETLGKSGYGFDSDYTNSYVLMNYSLPRFYSYRVFLCSATSETELTTGYDSACFAFTGDETYSNYSISWECPETTVNLGYNCLKIKLYTSTDFEEWASLADYVSPVLITKEIESSTWYFTMYVDVAGGYGAYRFGDTTYRSGITGIVFSEPLESEVQLWRITTGDYAGFVLGAYIDVIGEAVYVCILLGIAGVLYYQYKHFGVIAFFFSMFGGAGGLAWFLVPPWAAAVVSALVIIGTSFLVWRLIR